MKKLRNTTQIILPLRKPKAKDSEYDIYPSFDLGSGKIHCDFDSLAERIKGQKTVIIDGYVGVIFDDFITSLNKSLIKKGIKAIWWRTEAAMKPEKEINKLIEPWLGGDDPLFGKRAKLDLKDFFDENAIYSFKQEPKAQMNILIGIGAFLFGWKGLTLYLDIPKNEIQFRSRAGSITNLGASKPEPPKVMYKRFYFIDWVVLNRHKKRILKKIDIFVDAQRESEITWAEGSDIRKGLDTMAHSGFRVRPWFEPGAWGGQWVKKHIPALPSNVKNYAWSFELISPENGLIFESNSLLLEISFDFLMYEGGASVTGTKCHKEYGDEYPIRMDYLDTFDGGNLSVQCHPRKKYIQENFGERLTQEETYYILDAKKGSHVYLGFKAGVDPQEFRKALEKSHETTTELDVDKFINTEQSSKHDLYLIPPGTLHSAGKNNLVLEISTTPYIFTFKMYDWMRLDLDGKPRPLNISRAMDNLYFSRQGSYIKKNLVSHPYMIKKGNGWEQWELPTHPRHSYRIQRYVIDSKAEIKTEDNGNVLNLVDGDSAIIKTPTGLRHKLHYGETFVVSAAAGSYQIISPHGKRIMVVRAFMR
jgi:mannose-6-phosphate isomerase class I